MAKKTNNPRNSQSALFKSLTRLFSGPITTRRRQQVSRYKRRYLDKYPFTSATGQEFKKSKTNTVFDRLSLDYMTNQNRVERYAEFDQMEFEPILASVLDIYADEITTSSDLQPVLNIKCHNEEIKSLLHHLFYGILNIEFNLYYWVRQVCKSGDFFLYLDV